MKILLVCNAGMSSSILVQKIKDAAKKNNEDVIVSATSSKGLDDEKGKWDVCLLGPQISYALERIKGELEIPVLAIPPRDYAMADGESVLNLAKKLYQMEGK